MGTAVEVLFSFLVLFRSFFFPKKKVSFVFGLFVFYLSPLSSSLLSRDVLGVVRRGQGLLRGLVVLRAAEEHDLCFFVLEKKEERKG